MAPHEPSPVTIVGLGALGRSVAGALLEAGHPTTVWNRTAGRGPALTARGAIEAGDIAAAVDASPIVVVAVSSYADVEAVLAPVADRLAGRVVVNLTSGTPDQARHLADRLAGTGAAYLDAAAMSGTRQVGHPDALFLYSGDRAAFEAAREALAGLGRAEHLGPDVGTTAIFDTALLTLNLGVLAGFYHSAALVRSAGVSAEAFAAIAVGYLPFVTKLIGDHAHHVDAGTAPGDDGTLAVYADAVAHVIATSAQRGLATELPDAIKALVDRGVAAGHGDDGLPRLVDVIAGAAA